MENGPHTDMNPTYLYIQALAELDKYTSVDEALYDLIDLYKEAGLPTRIIEAEQSLCEHNIEVSNRTLNNLLSQHPQLEITI